jgi:hypothetical protein
LLERGIVLELLRKLGVAGNRAGDDLPQDPIVLVDQPDDRS